MTENKNYKALAEAEKESVLFKAVDKKDFSSFENIKDEFEKCGLMVGSVVITQFKGQETAKLFRAK